MQNLLAEIHPDRWTFLWDALTTISMHLCAAALILVVGWWVARRVARSLNRLLASQSRMDATLRPVISDTCLWSIRVVSIIGALSQLGIQTASIVAVLGAAGLAIGLALQGTMQNIAAGIMLLLLRPFKVGDYIDAGTGTVSGTVEEISLFTTRLTKSDGICEYVPNSALWSNSIRNYNRNPTRRLDLEVEISVRDDVDHALAALRKLAVADPRALQNPAPQVMVARFDDSTVVLNIRLWANIDTFWDMRWDLARQVRQTLNNAQCGLPVRTRELHIVQNNDTSESAAASVTAAPRASVQ
ncbi:Small-conductance mechanosensitive channel [Paraburkholderia domus]|jgi:small conductance mechanosensitive channel|uniref:mechanosensitive ion channel family protein n=1 Tax=Paraburkholderia domus TaxID=2793075 RepID=UPI001911AC6B|nr:mechanosensitive ion channel family protein [Paraburkholderia domus]MBK5063594.1 mechanosensitive ion channel family protein [Burkholderia sp. R-70199]MBK5089615.1 mechanosensitive ion channel family protein [Burkholderia sp. R-69927]MBK5182668.1 mechanosensitive ion channel family protein [Burkholderia sp. R-69749]MCI0148922.1 mechanosensitive ion channel [Paraburkholderia sediminicola]CAE6849856.1 Small-conductance mechanosensitive channel [Paraburkholderia domus]